MKKIKNWAVTALFIIGGIADIGFDTLTESAKYFNIDEKYVNILRIVVIAVALIKVKLEKPTRNARKLQEIANKQHFKDLQNDEGKGGAVLPTKGF